MIRRWFRLKNHYKDLIVKEGFGTKSIDKLLENIERSKENNLEKLLFGLGIRFVGETVAKKLAKTLKNIESKFNFNNFVTITCSIHG